MADFCAVMFGENCGFYFPSHRYDLFPVQHELKRRLLEYHVALIALANNETRYHPEENDIDYFKLEAEFDWETDFLGSPHTQTYAAYIIERSWMRYKVRKGEMSIERMTYTGRLRHETAVAMETAGDNDDDAMETAGGAYSLPIIEELEELAVSSAKNERTVLGKRRSNSQTVPQCYSPKELYRMLRLGSCSNSNN